MSLFEVIIGFVIGGGLTGSIILLWKMMVQRNFPITVPVAMQRGKSIVWDFNERGRVRKDKSGYEVLLMKNRKKDTLKPPKYDRLVVDKRGKPVMPVFNTISGQYFPMKLLDEGKNKRRLDMVEDKSAKNWAINEMIRLNSVYRPQESFLQRYGMYIMTATFAAMIIFFVIYMGGKIEISSNGLAAASQNLASASENLAKSLETWASTPPPSAPV